MSFPISDHRALWRERARALHPVLCRQERHITAPEGVFHVGDTVILDAGGYCVGYLTLQLAPVGVADSPVRLRVVCAEWPGELVGDFSDFPPGRGRSWLQDEVVNLDDLSRPFRLPRRYALRYLKIEILLAPTLLRIEAVTMETVSAVDGVSPAPAGLSPELAAIDQCAVRTLRWCMQSCFEDGPKRDRRLWLGDLRLQALANAVTFRRFDLVERSLYLLAGAAGDNGQVPGCVYDGAQLIAGDFVLDYSLLLGPTLLDHLRFSGRSEVVRELFELAVFQLNFATRHLDAEGIFQVPEGEWIFIDWQQSLDRQMPLQGVLIYAQRCLAALAEILGLAEKARELRSHAEHLTAAVRSVAYDPETGVIYSGNQRQISYAGQIWPILGGVLTPDEGRRALQAVLRNPAAIKPVTPYLWHHMLAALFYCGMKPEAEEMLCFYWGGMLRDGADTFYEAYVPEEPDLSLYCDRRLNSACHAWSCTPVYFLRAAAETLFLAK